MINCCLCGAFSDDTHLECGHQVCSVCLARSLTDQRKIGLFYGRCAVDGCGHIFRKHRPWPWNLGGRVQLRTRTNLTLGYNGLGRGRGGIGDRGGIGGLGGICGLGGISDRGGIGSSGGISGLGRFRGGLNNSGLMDIGSGGGLLGVGSDGSSSGSQSGFGSGNGNGGSTSSQTGPIIIDINVINFFNYYTFIIN